ncbi:C40 family peptidase [Nocardioidaceae bacterium]|nr:C40 family peptidase [Nocardioidaceae bacterium]
MSAHAHSTARRALRVVALPLVAMALVFTGLTVTAPAAEAASPRIEKIRKAMRIAVAQKGDPYRYGAAGPNAFDCSGLIYYSYRKAGFRNVPRTSDSQAAKFRGIPKRKVRRGDFVYFHRGGDVYHVGIFAGRRAGNKYVLHAPYGSKRVSRERIWTNSWFAGSLR